MAAEHIDLTSREILEIKHCLFYANSCAHGTVGHNLLILVAKFAEDKGFRLVGNQLDIPVGVTVIQDQTR